MDRFGTISGSYTPQLTNIRSATRRGAARYRFMNLTTGSNNVDIANAGVAGESKVIRIGTLNQQTSAFLEGVYGKTIGGTTKAVVVNGSGRLGTAPAPAAPLSSNSQTIHRLRAENHRQSAQLRQQRAQNRQQSTELRQQDAAIQRLRQQMQNGG